MAPAASTDAEILVFWMPMSPTSPLGAPPTLVALLLGDDRVKLSKATYRRPSMTLAKVERSGD